MALFGKSAPRPEETDRNRPAPGVPMPPPMRQDPPRTEAKTAVIGPHVRIQGELSADEDVVIEGRVEGKIAVTKSVRVGNNAQVNAEVKGQSVVIAGRVVGNVTAVERVEILPTGSLEGNIRAPKIVIAEGAQFKGSVDMGGKPPAPESAPAAKPGNPGAPKP